MTMPSVEQPAPWIPPMEQEAVEEAIDRCNTRLLELGQAVMDQLDKSHSGFFTELNEAQRLAFYLASPSQQQLMVAYSLVLPLDPATGMPVSPDVAEQMTAMAQSPKQGPMPAKHPDLLPYVEAIATAEDRFVAWLIFLSHLRPDKAEQIARDYARIGRRLVREDG